MNFKRSISRLLSFVMCFALLLSMGSFAFAEGEETCQHVYNDGVVTTEASCTAAGVKTYTCTVDGCGAFYFEPVPAAHSYDAGVVTVAPDCTTAGVKTYTCTVDGCGAFYFEPVPATDHVYNEGQCNCGAEDPANEPDPIDDSDPAVCTGDENCTATGDDVVHTGNCPKASVVLDEPPVCNCVAKCAEGSPDTSCTACAVSTDLLADCAGACTMLEDCTAVNHATGCLSTVCSCDDGSSDGTKCTETKLNSNCPVCNDSADLANECKGKKLPAASVIPYAAETIPANGYTAWPSGDTSVSRPLQIVVGFGAQETAEEARQNGYGEWLADFYLSFSGIKAGTVTADGCYLAGNYGSWGWYVIPVDGTDVSNGVTYPVMGSAVAPFTYEAICDSVQNFKAAIYIHPDILKENPDFSVSLSLKVSDPESDDTITIGQPLGYDVPSLLGISNPVARIDNASGGSFYENLEDAIADSTSGDIITVLDDVILNSAVTLKSGTTLLSGDYSVTGTVNSTVILKTGDTVLGYYTELNSALTAANTLSGEVTVEIYDKVEYAANTPKLNGAYSKLNFVGKDTDAEIYLNISGTNGYISGEGSNPAAAVTFTGLTLSKVYGSGTVYDAAFMNCCFTVHRTASVSYTNCSFPNGACAAGGPTTYTGCNFGTSHDKYGMWIYGSTSVLVDNCTFTGRRGIKLYHESSAITVQNCDFAGLTTDEKPAIVLTKAAGVTLSGNKNYPSKGVFELDLDGVPNGTPVTADIADIACMNDNYADCGVLMDGKIYIDIEAAIAAEGDNKPITLFYDPAKDISLGESATIVDNGNTLSGEITITDVDVTLTAPEGLNVVSGVSGYVVIYNNGVYRLGVYIAETGGESYETITAAVAAAADSGTVKLLRSSSESFTANKNITFDPNGLQYTGTVTVAAGKVMTVDIADLQAQTGGLKLGAGQGTLSVGGKQIALPQGGTVTAAADGSITAAPNSSTGDLAPVKYNGFTLLVTNSALTIKADGSVDIPVGSTVVFPSGNTVIAMHGGVLSADGVLSTTPAQEQEYGYGKVSIVDADGNKYTAFVPTGSELKVQEKNGALVYSSSSKEAPIVCKGDLAKPVLTIDPKRKAFYKYGLGTLKFTCNGFSSTLVRISMDNVGLNDNAYTVEAGSTIVKLKNEYLKTLALGDHVLKLTYADGQTVTATISVVNTPVTGDSNHLALFTIMMAGCLASATGLFLILRKRIKG